MGFMRYAHHSCHAERSRGVLLLFVGQAPCGPDGIGGSGDGPTLLEGRNARPEGVVLSAVEGRGSDNFRIGKLPRPTMLARTENGLD